MEYFKSILTLILLFLEFIIFGKVGEDVVVQSPILHQVNKVMDTQGENHNNHYGKFGSNVFREKTSSQEKSRIFLDIRTCKLSYRTIVYDSQERQSITSVLSQIHGKSHPFVMQPDFWRAYDDKLFLQGTYAEGKNLNYCLRYFDYSVTEEIVTFFAAQIVLALNFLHKNDIVHGNLTLKNILLFKDGYIKVDDFGLSTVSNARSILQVGSVEYAAPEVHLKKLCDPAADWWSLGIMMGILMGRYPFDINRVIDSIILDEPILPIQASASCKIFMRGLLTKNQNARLHYIDFAEGTIQQHDVFASIPWQDLAQKKFKPTLKIKYMFTDNIYYVVEI